VGRHIFLIKYSKQVVGFTFIRDPASTESVAHQVAEFYVRSDSRRLGIGRSAVLEIWKLFPGQWELQVHTRNTAAIQFWLSCIETETGDNPQLQEIKDSDGRRLQLNFRIGQSA
jgi:predicted acetyltransferase